MKICFLCNSLEPGRDGVGDYTRLLAGACEAAGHATACFALRDPFATGDDPRRFTDALGDAAQQARLLAQIKDFSPDWISLQFVPYGLHPKGLPRRLPGLLRACRGPWRWQVMFHEIWIGGKLDSPLKDRLVGLLQRRIIRRATDIISPLVHTHAEPYRVLLDGLGLHARPLPLFSNIPPQAGTAEGILYPFLNTHGFAISDRNRKQFHLGGLFGTLHPEWPPQPLLNALREAARHEGRRIALIHFGGIGPGKALWESLMRDNDEHLALFELGRLDADAASRLINTLDFGLASSPRSLLQKSGSAITLIEHGLPVIVNRDDAHYPGIPRELPLGDPQYIAFDGTLPDNFFNLRSRAPASRLPAVAETFLHDLGA
ncbi:hypothetical protein H5P28_09775 [Ruficoccus amylovorans]|uniref:Uncharacterized protein n=1 Tax=Ruficoccus amylovorans TaxID=1804625 RepID=A0A842HFY6_9BACT|nr:hypothetical protein [Ruficoccus amylovorans]MBC2594546.1 hypothetical protein [Ruficoccus amylovorans]